MAKEIQINPNDTGSTYYFTVQNDTNGQIYNGSTFEAISAANWANYDIAMAEQDGTGLYTGDFPVISAGQYRVSIRKQAGGSPAITDLEKGAGLMIWDGSAEVYQESINDIADGILDRADGVESSRTIREALRLMLSALVGKISGANTTNIKIRDTGDSKDRIDATVDAYGNRTAVVLDDT